MRYDTEHIGKKEKYDCDMCGFTYYKKDMHRKDGYYVCDDCYDEPSYKDTRKRKNR